MKHSIFSITLVTLLTACGGEGHQDTIEKPEAPPIPPVQKYYEDISHFSGGYTPTIKRINGFNGSDGEKASSEPFSIDSKGNFVMKFGGSVLVGKLDINDGLLIGELETIGSVDRVGNFSLDTWIRDNGYAMFYASSCASMTSDSKVFEESEGNDHRHNPIIFNITFNDCRGNDKQTATMTLDDTYHAYNINEDRSEEYAGHYTGNHYWFRDSYTESPDAYFVPHKMNFHIDYNGIITGTDIDGCEYYGYAEKVTEEKVHDVTLSLSGCEIDGEYIGSLMPWRSGFKLSVSNDQIALTRTLYIDHKND